MRGYLSIATIFKSKFFWIIALITVSVLSSFMAIHGLWIESWLQTVSKLPQSTIDNYLVLMAIAMTVSLLSTGYIAKLAMYYKKSLESILAYLVVIYIITELLIITADDHYDWVWWILLSLISQIFNLSYAILTQHFQKSHSGRANTALNVVVFASVFLVQYLIGLIVTISSQHFSLATSYKISFMVPVIIQVICIGLFLILWKQRSGKVTLENSIIKSIRQKK